METSAKLYSLSFSKRKDLFIRIPICCRKYSIAAALPFGSHGWTDFAAYLFLYTDCRL